MLAEKYQKDEIRPFDLSKLNASKAVRNFLCDYLYRDKLILSYTPASEFGSQQAYKWLTGAYVCDYEGVGNTIAPRTKINYRIITQLYEAGMLKLKGDIRTPHVRCIIFEWRKETIENRREIVNTKIFKEDIRVDSGVIKAIAATVGLKVRYIPSRSIFEVRKGPNEEAIPYKEAKHTYIFMNAQGQPVSGWRDMSYMEWEGLLYKIAKQAKTIKKPLNTPLGTLSHFSQFKRQ